MKVKLLSCVQLFAIPWTAAFQAPSCPWDFLGKSTGVGCHRLIQIVSLEDVNSQVTQCNIEAMATVFFLPKKLPWDGGREKSNEFNYLISNFERGVTF